MHNIIQKILISDSFTSKLSISLNGTVLPSHEGNEALPCKSCLSRLCIKKKTDNYVCEIGLVSYTIGIEDNFLTAYGYTNENSPNIKNKSLKAQLKGRALKRQHFESGLRNTIELIECIEEYQFMKSSEVLHYFHDVSKWATAIENASEKVIERQNGNTFKEKVAKSSSDSRVIYQSSKLLTETLNMIEVYFNPASASFEGKRRVEVYKLFDKVQSVLFHTIGKKYNKRFRISGTLYRDIDAYQSFQIIPLSLLQNALKYSKENEIDILLEEHTEGIYVSIESIGPHIEDSEIDRIFEKKYRGKYAIKMDHDGMGIGLYVSQLIANIHGFEIKVESKKLSTQINSIPLAQNRFYFTIPV